MVFNSVFLIISLLYITDLLLLVPWYNRSKFDHTPRKKKLLRKAACIGLPLVILVAGCGILAGLGYAGGDWALLLFPVGMLICAFGDIVIEIRFTKGGLLFGFAHLVYITGAIYLLHEIHGASIVCFLILAIMGSALTVKFLTRKHRGLMIAYNIVISASFALGLGLVLQGVTGHALVGYGLMCLVVSDWLLARNRTFKSSPVWSIVSLLLYFGGQIMISTYPYLR